MSKKESAARVMAKDLIAGCFGGIGIVAAGHPFDTLKVHILLKYFQYADFPLLVYVCKLRTLRILSTMV